MTPVSACGRETLAPGSFKVQVIYALPEGVQMAQVSVAAGATIADALDKSGLVEPADLERLRLKVAIFGRLKSISQVLVAGDRIEVLRALVAEPNRSRLARARKKDRVPPA